MTLALYKKADGNLVSKLAETQQQEEQLRAEGYLTPQELWPGPADPAEPAQGDAPKEAWPAEASDAPGDEEVKDEPPAATPIDEPRPQKRKK
jgi:hypothetical protein